MNDTTKRNIVLAVMTVILVLVTRYAIKQGIDKNNAAQPVTREVYLLDTYCSVSVFEGGAEDNVNAALEHAVKALNEYDALLNYSREGSDIYNINHRASDSVVISEDTAALLRLGREFCELTDGALEPAIRPVTYLWDFKNEKKVPEEAVLKEALSHVGVLPGMLRRRIPLRSPPLPVLSRLQNLYYLLRRLP